MSVSAQSTLLERIAWEDLDSTVPRQQRNREHYAPGISLFRWWARRPHALIGEILDAASGDSMRVSDPFSGGGTVAMEAARRGLDVYAQDLHPWAATGVASALRQVDASELSEAGEAWLHGLLAERISLYGGRCPVHKADSEVITAFWVRRAPCPDCGTDVYLYPYPLISLASRGSGETQGYFGCASCGSVTRSRLTTRDRRCSSCHRALGTPDRALHPGGVTKCPQQGCDASFPGLRVGGVWRPVLVQRVCGSSTHLDRPTDEEVAAAIASFDEVPGPLREEIPLGLETKRLHRAGLTRWVDLYPRRQVRSMITAARVLRELDLEHPVRARLLLALCGASEMAGYLSRWDRYYPKAFEATANHRFNLTGLAAETNLLADRGRGTFAHRVAQSVRAAEWASEFKTRSVMTMSSRRRSRLTPEELDGATVVCGSSRRQLLPDASVDLILTDPPYFDDVQYAELGSMFLVWARAVGLVGNSIKVDFRSEAVLNEMRGSDVERYCDRLAAVLREARRTLRPRGRMVLTYHNTDGRAWWALSRALGRAGFWVAALAVVHTENETDHSKRNRRAFSRDLVLECHLVHRGEPVVASRAWDDQSSALIAAGRAVAKLAGQLASGNERRSWTYRRFARAYGEYLDGKNGYIRFPNATSELKGKRNNGDDRGGKGRADRRGGREP
jgi:putative DNA methylase